MKLLNFAMKNQKILSCVQNQKTFKQIAEWLEELKANRIALEKANGYLEANYRLGYSKGIAERLKAGNSNES